MNYKNLYDTICNNAKNRILTTYTEEHHILPRSLGGTDEPANLVALTAREHFICHILLTKFTRGTDKSKMVRAAIMMKASNTLQDRYFNSQLYETVRIAYSDRRSIEQEGENNTFYGKKHSAVTRAKMSASKKEKYSNGNHPHIGMKRSEETCANISNSKKGKPSAKKGIPQGPKTAEQVAKIKERLAGASYWWTDGVNNVRGASCPDGYKKGRTMSPFHIKAFVLKQ